MLPSRARAALVVVLCALLLSPAAGFEAGFDESSFDESKHDHELFGSENILDALREIKERGRNSVVDELANLGYKPKGEEIKYNTVWDNSILSTSGFGPGHQEFHMFADMLKNVIRSHQDPDSGIPEGQRMSVDKKYSDPEYVKSLQEKVKENEAAYKSDPGGDHDHVAHASDRLHAFVALQLAADAGGCEDESDVPPPSDDEMDGMGADEKAEEVGSELGDKLVANMPNKGEVKEQTVYEMKEVVTSWSLMEGGLDGQLKPCQSTTCAERGNSGITCPSIISGADFDKATYLFTTEMKKDRGRGCGCTTINSNKWTPELYEVSTPVPSDAAADLVVPMCLCARTTPDDKGCHNMLSIPKQGEPVKAYNVCMCFNQRLLVEGPRRAWLSEAQMISLGLKERLNADVILGNRDPLPAQPKGLFAWRTCKVEACTTGNGQDCSTVPINKKPADAILEPILDNFREVVKTSVSEKCLCATSKHQRFQTHIFQGADGRFCLAAVSYNQECVALNPGKRACMCFDKWDGAKQWSDLVLDEAGVQEISEANGLGCTAPLVTLPKSEKLSWEYVGKGVAKAAMKGKDTILSGLKGLSGALKFKWNMTMASYPKPGQAFGVHMICGPIIQCARVVIGLIVKIVTAILEFFFDIVRLFLKVMLKILPGAGKAVGNIWAGGVNAVANVAAFAKRKLAEADLAIQGDFRRDNTFNNLMDDDTKKEMTKSLVPNSAAEASNQLCKQCSANLVLSASFPLGPIPDISKIGLGLIFAPIPKPTLWQLTAGTMKACGACVKEFALWAASPFRRDTRYQDDFINSCNAVTVGMCYMLATQRRIRMDTKTAINGEDGKGFFFQGVNADDDADKFCSKFGDNTFLDLYRSKESKVGSFSDIQCGTPDGTPTPGMKVKDICMGVNTMVKARFNDDESCWTPQDDAVKKEPWNYFENCKELFECGPFNPIEHKEEIRREAANFAVEKWKMKVVNAMIKAQTEENKNLDARVAGLEETLGNMLHATDEIDEQMRRRFRIARADNMWKHDVGLAFLNHMFAKPECMQVRAMTAQSLREFVAATPLFEEMMRAHDERLVEIEQSEDDGLSWEPAFGTSCDAPNNDPRTIMYRHLFCVMQNLRTQHLMNNGYEGAKEYLDKEKARRAKGQTEAAKIFKEGREAQATVDPDDTLDTADLIKAQLAPVADAATAVNSKAATVKDKAADAVHQATGVLANAGVQPAADDKPATGVISDTVNGAVTGDAKPIDGGVIGAVQPTNGATGDVHAKDATLPVDGASPPVKGATPPVDGGHILTDIPSSPMGGKAKIATPTADDLLGPNTNAVKPDTEVVKPATGLDVSGQPTADKMELNALKKVEELVEKLAQQELGTE